MERYRFIVFLYPYTRPTSSNMISYKVFRIISSFMYLCVRLLFAPSRRTRLRQLAFDLSIYLHFLSLSSTTTGAFGRLCTTQPPPHPPPLSIAHLIYSPASSTVADISNCPLYTLVYLSFSVYVRFADGCEKRSTNHDER